MYPVDLTAYVFVNPSLLKWLGNLTKILVEKKTIQSSLLNKYWRCRTKRCTEKKCM